MILIEMSICYYQVTYLGTDVLGLLVFDLAIIPEPPAGMIPRSSGIPLFPYRAL